MMTRDGFKHIFGVDILQLQYFLHILQLQYFVSVDFALNVGTPNV